MLPNNSWKWSPGGLTPIGGAHYLGEGMKASDQASPVGSPTVVLSSLGGEGEGVCSVFIIMHCVLYDCIQCISVCVKCITCVLCV